MSECRMPLAENVLASRREDHPVDAELVGDRDGMQSAGTAEGQKAERARIETLLEQAEPNRRGEACIGQGEDALGGALRVEPERARDMRLDRRPRALDIELQARRRGRIRHRAGLAPGSRPSPSAACRRRHSRPAPDARRRCADRRRGARPARPRRSSRRRRRRCGSRSSAGAPAGRRSRPASSASSGHPERRRRRSSCRPYRCRRGSGSRAWRRRAAPRALRRSGRTAEAAQAARSRPPGCTRHRSTAREGAVPEDRARHRRSFELAQVGAHDRDKQRVQHRRRAALVFADLGAHLRG